MKPHFQECDLGFTYQNDNVVVFYGKANATLKLIEHKFSQFQFYRIKQTHSDILVEASTEVVEADAHWTKEKNHALLIVTADCTPLMIHNKQSGVIAVIHAGWRGVANQITFKTMKFLTSNESNSDDFEIWSGPHILQDSFEVQSDVLNQLVASAFVDDQSVLSKKIETGYLVDLSQILLSQILKVVPGIQKFHFLNLDTKTDLRFHSYRRGKASIERNLSFIAKL